MKITSETVSPAASSVPPSLTTEQWSALDPLRWRFVTTMRLRRTRFGRDARRDCLAALVVLDRYGQLMPGNEAEAATLLDAYLDRNGSIA